jgi:hypothetical protein
LKFGMESTFTHLQKRSLLQIPARAQDMAVDTFDETYAAMKRNPLLTLGIALGIAFAFGRPGQAEKLTFGNLAHHS